MPVILGIMGSLVHYAGIGKFFGEHTLEPDQRATILDYLETSLIL